MFCECIESTAEPGSYRRLILLSIITVDHFTFAFADKLALGAINIYLLVKENGVHWYNGS